MKKKIITITAILSIAVIMLGACASQPGQAPDLAGQEAGEQSTRAPAGEKASLKALAANSVLADIAQNVAGDRVKVASLIPLGLDPHAFEPTPQDVAKIAESQIFIVNGGGFEEWLAETIENAGGERLVVEASAGLSMRKGAEGEPQHEGEEHEQEGGESHHHEGDPHFWLDPNHVIRYVENIRDGLSQVDPAGEEIYAKNAETYIGQLKELDGWIGEQVKQISAERRVLVTDHDNLGYFADRYGFKVVGAIIPSVSTGSSPSAQELAGLIQQIRESGAAAVFMDITSNPKMAQQIAAEAGVKVVSDLYTHSVTEAGGPAPSYLEMMRLNVNRIVEALK